MIEQRDLLRLGELATIKLEEALRRRPDRKALYEDRLVGICLCQGAADHYVNFGTPKSRGVNDFDVWAFYDRADRIGFWNRKSSYADFGPSKFGSSPSDPDRVTGRRVDIFWRAIDQHIGLNPFNSIIEYLANPKTDSSRALSRNPAVIVWPDAHLGQVIWEPPPSLKPVPPKFEWTKEL
jgi:hypothetical protein